RRGLVGFAGIDHYRFVAAGRQVNQRVRVGRVQVAELGRASGGRDLVCLVIRNNEGKIGYYLRLKSAAPDRTRTDRGEQFQARAGNVFRGQVVLPFLVHNAIVAAKLDRPSGHFDVAVSKAGLRHSRPPRSTSKKILSSSRSTMTARLTASSASR